MLDAQARGPHAIQSGDVADEQSSGPEADGLSESSLPADESPRPIPDKAIETPPAMVAALTQLADGLERHTAEGLQALRQGGAQALDDRTAPNTDGTPRSVELHRLFGQIQSAVIHLRTQIERPDTPLDGEAERMKALCLRVLEIGDELVAVGEIAPPTNTSNPAAEDPRPGVQDRAGPVAKLDGWTKLELITQANSDDSGDRVATLSNTAFDRIKNLSPIERSERGGRGQQRRFSIAELRLLISAAESSSNRQKARIVRRWRELLRS
ncbi:MAG: hypothetical protein AAGG07_06320 [Planctomycetota bacterium]